MVALRGIAEDLPVEEWFNDWIWPIESNLTETVVELGALLACAEMIRGGVTTFADHYFAMDRVAAAVTRSGMRANLGWGYFSSQGAEGRERSLDFALRVAGAADGRITTSLAPHAPYTVDDEDLAATARLAHEHGLMVHLHAAENRAQTDHSVERHGLTPVEVLGAAARHGPDRGRHRAARLPQIRLGHDPDPVARLDRPARGAGDRRRRLQQHPRRVGVHDAHRARTEVDGA
jgi:5-methylthioadenosine/S-adenosylhomocysteine deaminase